MLSRKLAIKKLVLYEHDLQNADPTVLSVLRNGLKQCTSVTTVALTWLGNEEGLELLLRPTCYNSFVTGLTLRSVGSILRARGGEILCGLLVGNKNLLVLDISHNRILEEPAGPVGLGQGLALSFLQSLSLEGCDIANTCLTNLVASMGDTSISIKNTSLTRLILTGNNISGAEGGRQVTLQADDPEPTRQSSLSYWFGPIGARTLAPGIAAASHLEELLSWQVSARKRRRGESRSGRTSRQVIDPFGSVVE
jgi:Leucine Rich repeat